MVRTSEQHPVLRYAVQERVAQILQNVEDTLKFSAP
jgi:hypothetical protein